MCHLVGVWMGEIARSITCSISMKYFKAKGNGWCIFPRSVPPHLHFGHSPYSLWCSPQVSSSMVWLYAVVAYQLWEGSFMCSSNYYGTSRWLKHMTCLWDLSLAKGLHINSNVMCAKLQISICLTQVSRTGKSRKFSQKQ